jgi:hypothetical protein
MFASEEKCITNQPTTGLIKFSLSLPQSRKLGRSESFARFWVFTVVKIQVEVFWDVMPCSVVVGYQHFGGPYCLHLQGGDGGSKVQQNVGILLQYYMALHPLRPQHGSRILCFETYKFILTACHFVHIHSTYRLTVSDTF